MGADKVAFTPAPAAPPADQKLPEAKVVTQDGAETKVTVNTTQVAPKANEAKPDRPSWLPEEFESPEAFAEAYKASKTAKQTEGEQKVDPKTATPDDATKAVKAAGLDMNEFSREYAEKGELSAESIAKLEKAGITKAVVDTYIEGQKAQAAVVQTRLAEALGGKENLDATLQWAGTALNADEIAAANAALAAGEAQARLVLQGLNARRLAEVGSEPGFVSGRSSPGRGEVQGYESTAQMISDMNSPQYRSDPAFREQVARRLAASKF